jgi:Rod binding domain-containing protein
MDASLALLEAQSQASDEVRRALEMARLRAELQPPQDRKVRLREACEGFEAIFIQKIWEQMRKNVPQEGYLHSRDEAMYQAMYDQEFARKMASAGGIGLADMLYDQLAQRLGDSARTASPRNNPRLPIVPAASSPVGKNLPAPNLHGEDQKP